jgi:hypothetical protein
MTKKRKVKEVNSYNAFSSDFKWDRTTGSSQSSGVFREGNDSLPHSPGEIFTVIALLELELIG